MVNKLFVILILLFSICSCAKIQANNQVNILQDSTQIDQSPPDAPLGEIDTSQITYPYTVIVKNGEIFKLDTITNKSTQLSNTHNQITEAFISQSNKYVVAYRKTRMLINQVYVLNNQEETQVFEFVVYNLCTNKLIRQFGSSRDIYISFEYWFSTSRFLFTTADGVAVSGSFVYDACRDSVQEVKYGYDSQKY